MRKTFFAWKLYLELEDSFRRHFDCGSFVFFSLEDEMKPMHNLTYILHSMRPLDHGVS